MKNLVRILAVILLGFSVTGCELFSPKFWREVDEHRREIGKGIIEEPMEFIIVRTNMGIGLIKWRE